MQSQHRLSAYPQAGEDLVTSCFVLTRLHDLMNPSLTSAQPIYSMTGFAHLQKQSAIGQFNFELRSVNHRYFELQVKAEESLRSVEPWVRELIASKIQRGKVECKLALGLNQSDDQRARLDADKLTQLVALQQSVLQHSPHSAALSVKEILSWPGVMQDSVLNGEQMEQHIRQALQQLLDDLLQHRAREGAKLAQFIHEKNQQILAQLSLLPPLLAQSMQAYQAKLVSKINEAVKQVDTERLQQEVVYFAQRVDVEEEISRLHVHCKELNTILQQGGPVGKRLDFLMQEFNREANTLASKSISNEVTQIALALKLLIEQMREQVQNLE